MLLRHIHYFLAVAEHRNFTRAANAVHVSQPALSQQIKQLEERLGTQLFDRSGRQVRLTDAGQVYADHARRALRDLAEGERAIHDVADLSRGQLRIAFTPTFTPYLIGPLTAAFHARYGQVRVQLEELSQERMEAGLVADEFDLGIGFAGVQHAELDTRPLLEERLALVVRTGHALTRQASVDARELKALPMILLSPAFATRAQIDRYCHQHEAPPEVLMEADSVTAVIEMVRHTELASLLPAQVAQQRDDLVALPLEPAQLVRSAVLIQRRDGYHSAASRAFAALAQDCALILATSHPPGLSQSPAGG